MTDEKLYNTLAQILSELSEEEYPEICGIIRDSIDPDDKIVFPSEKEISDHLMDADKAKPLPACAAAFLMESYQEAMEPPPATWALCTTLDAPESRITQKP